MHEPLTNPYEPPSGDGYATPEPQRKHSGRTDLLARVATGSTLSTMIQLPMLAWIAAITMLALGRLVVLLAAAAVGLILVTLVLRQLCRPKPYKDSKELA